jgi:hypothetical protein
MYIGFKIPKLTENPETGEKELDYQTYAKAAEWANNNNAEIVEYDDFYLVEEVPPPPPTKTVRTFSKFSIWVATQNIPMTLPDGTASSVWTAFESFLKNEKMPNGDTLYSGWMNLNDLVEDNQFFKDFYPLAVEAFGKELVDQVLAASVTSSQTVIVEVTPEEPETPENGTETGDNTEPDAEQGDDAEPPAETPKNGKEPESEPEQTE